MKRQTADRQGWLDGTPPKGGTAALRSRSDPPRRSISGRMRVEPCRSRELRDSAPACTAPLHPPLSLVRRRLPIDFSARHANEADMCLRRWRPRSRAAVISHVYA